MYCETIPFATKAARTLAAFADAALNASLLAPATTETVAFNRTASGLTFTVPLALTEMYRSAACALEGTAPNPAIDKAMAIDVIRRSFIALASHKSPKKFLNN